MSNFSSSFSYFYTNENGEQQFKGAINSKVYDNIEAFIEALKSESNLATSEPEVDRDEVGDTPNVTTTAPQNKVRPAYDINDFILTCPQSVEDGNYHAYLDLLEKKRNKFSAVVNELSHEFIDRIIDAANDIVPTIQDTLKKTLEMIECRAVELSKIEKLYVKSDELVSALRNIPEQQEAQKKISKTIYERYERTEKEKNELYKWKELYEASINYYKDIHKIIVGANFD